MGIVYFLLMVIYIGSGYEGLRMVKTGQMQSNIPPFLSFQTIACINFVVGGLLCLATFIKLFIVG